MHVPQGQRGYLVRHNCFGHGPTGRNCISYVFSDQPGVPVYCDSHKNQCM